MSSHRQKSGEEVRPIGRQLSLGNPKAVTGSLFSGGVRKPGLQACDN
jgi:hypothetical protein